MKHKPRSLRRAARTNRPAIFGAGLVALDLVIGADADAPIRAWAGGTCGNVLAILGFLGWDAYPIARLNNTDAAAIKVKADLKRWGVHLDHAACAPLTDTPIIVQEIRCLPTGEPTHRFRWSCPQCGHWLPGYRPVTIRGAESVRKHVNVANVFFMDRPSPSALALATEAAAHGALVFFEPSARSDSRLLEAALSIAHIVKYAEQRMDLRQSGRPGSSIVLEIRTMGTQGLRYRSWLPKAPTRGWQHLRSVKAPVVRDTCGAGDWCTAGIIHTLALHGQKGLSKVSPADLKRSLRYAQGLAAWNCGFEGARGGMYVTDRRTFDKQIQQIARGAATPIAVVKPTSDSLTRVRCPACPVAS